MYVHTHTDCILYIAFQYWNDKLCINLNLLLFMLNVVILIWLTDTEALPFFYHHLSVLFRPYSFRLFRIIYYSKRSNWSLFTPRVLTLASKFVQQIRSNYINTI